MMEIKFTKRFETSLKAFCNANGLTAEDYVIKAVEEKLNLDMYGDMNLLLKKEEPKKKRATRKKVEKPVEPEVKTEPLVEEVTEKSEEPVKTEEKIEEPKPVKRKLRTLAVK